MKNYRYHVIQANRPDPVSTHRNPVQAFLAANRYAQELPAEYGVKDTKAGGVFIANTADFGAAYTHALHGGRDFPPPPR